MKLHGAIAVLVSLMIATSAFAQRATLRVGSDAPTLEVGQWLAGGSKKIEKDNVYVIEFWATWCAPCRAAIPHLTHLQEHYAVNGLEIIGISTESEDDVKRFVDAQGSRIGYTIAVDNNQATHRLWMQAANRDTIPTAFIVDRRGKIQFIGNPNSEEFDRVLSLVVRGRYDARLYEQARPTLQAAENARRMRNWRQVFTLFDQVIEVDNYIFAPLEIDKFHIMMVDMRDPEAAYRHAREIRTKYANDPNLLVNLGTKIASDPDIPDDVRDLDLALELAQQGSRGIRDDQPNMMADLALVHYHRGELDNAVSYQRRAWMMATPSRKAGFERVLRNYQAAAGTTDDETSRGTQRGSTFRR